MASAPSATLWHDIRVAYDAWRQTQQSEPLPLRAIDAFLAGWEAANKKMAKQSEKETMDALRAMGSQLSTQEQIDAQPPLPQPQFPANYDPNAYTVDGKPYHVGRTTDDDPDDDD